ncbi:membrane dipeptidase [Thalassococcus sp. S3]|uniref:membrane dipeptidase n=1 Tax=Thalassococcus sp. S3 TaxID=2017482 RepID=UPI0010245383|nr:membrane dipeptidase [Thalassococcus sp. S3]QBF33003.1 peptidase M19 [Thalassococcus sp. S3]
MRAPLIDCLQYANWSPEIFRQMRAGGVDAVHVTVAYHETFSEMVGNLVKWNRWFELFPDLIVKGRTARDIDLAQNTNRTAIFFGLQNPGPIRADIGLVEICHELGIRFMQLTYNMQSLLGSGCFEETDSGLTQFGRQVVGEMNRIGMVVDLSHAGIQTIRDIIDCSGRPVALTHANPEWWHPARRNVSDDVLRALAGRGGMIGFSLYPHHLKDGSDCRLESFCDMVAEAASRYGSDRLGIGSDLCQDQPDSVVEWMRTGRWSKQLQFGEGSRERPGFPHMPSWFKDNRDFGHIRAGLLKTGFSTVEVDGIMGANWARFFAEGFEPEAGS